VALTKVGKEGITGISNSSDATAITIDSSENVGIGTTTPGSYNSGADDLVIATTGATGITIASGTSNNGSLFFADGTSGADQYRGYIQYEQTNNAMAFGTNGAERMRIDSAGAIRLANTSMNIDNSGNTATGLSVQSTGVTHIATSGNNTSLVIQRVSDTGTDNAIFFMYGSAGVGSVQVTSSSTAYNTSSDYRLKTAVNYDWDATTRLKQLKPARFKWIVDGDDAVPVDGFLAHEAQTVVPEAVTGTHNEVDDDGNAVMQGIDQSKIVPLLVKSLQEAITKIETLEAKVQALEDA
jgi:hypothetical protein